MNRLTFLVFLLVFGLWDFETNAVWAGRASKPASSNLSVQSVSPADFERGILNELHRRYGRSPHHLTLKILFPKEALKVPRGKTDLRNLSAQLEEYQEEYPLSLQ